MTRPLIIVALFFFLILSPVAAQDEPTAEPSAAATVEAAPIAILTAEPAPVSVDMGSGSGSVTINTGSTPPSAPTPDTSNSVPTPVVIVFAIVFGVIFVALLLNQQIIIKAVAPLSPPETTKAILDSMMPTLMSAFMNTIPALIPGEIDDKGFIEAARLRGLIVTLGADGLYHTARAAVADPTPSSTPVNTVAGVSTTRFLTDPGPTPPAN